MASSMKFRFKRNATSATHDPDAIGYEATVNVDGWPAPQVLAVGLEDESFGDFRGDQGASGTLELRYVDDAGNKSAEPLSKSFSLPDNFAPATPEDTFEVEITGEEQATPPSPPEPEPEPA